MIYVAVSARRHEQHSNATTVNRVLLVVMFRLSSIEIRQDIETSVKCEENQRPRNHKSPKRLIANEATGFGAGGQDIAQGIEDV